METVVLEQYLRMLYPEVKTWVKERDPTTASEAVACQMSGAYRYAGLTQAIKDKSEGPGKGSASSCDTYRQVKTFMPFTLKPMPAGTHPKKKAEVVCFNCGEPGHIQPL